jgi:hypothetical protein
MGGRMITPEQFKNEMQNIIVEFGNDTEVLHARIDSLMESTLEELGYGEGVKLIEDLELWYA